MPTVYLVRHGAIVNPKHVIKGRLAGFPLSKEGQNLALAAAKLIPESVKKVFTSPLLRTKQTAEIIAQEKNCPVIVLEDLNEWETQWTGMNEETCVRSKEWNAFLLDPEHCSITEMYPAMRARMLNAYRHILKTNPSSVSVAVSHGDPIGALVSALEGKKIAEYRSGGYPRMGGVVRIVAKNKTDLRPKITWLTKSEEE